MENDTTKYMEDLIAQSEKSRDNIYKSLDGRYSELTQALQDTTKIRENLDGCFISMKNLDNKVEDEVIHWIYLYKCSVLTYDHKFITGFRENKK